ncbi:MAG: elongation factor P [Deferribacteraceae bacterium]|jgi:elongation factor P|nr:elongation factor P [Deferribacteraceae bacterium]
MAVITPNQFKKGIKIEIDGEPYSVVEYLHIKVGRGGANVRTKVKNLISGRVIERTYISDEKIKQPDFEQKQMQYLYRDADNCYFMDSVSFEQFDIPVDVAGDAKDFMAENTIVTVQIFNKAPIGITLPNFVELPVVETDPGLKGDTVTGATKPAKLSAGGIVSVPLFINIGDIIKVDTREGVYIERIKRAD